MLYQLRSSPWVEKVTPIALTLVAGVGVVGTATLAAVATPKALEKKAEAEKEKGKPLTVWEKFKTMTPSYIPAVGTGIITIGAIGGILLNSSRKQAELATVIAGGNQIINKISKKYGMLHDTVKEKQPDIIEEFDKRNFDDVWNEYVKKKANKKEAWCQMRSFPDVWGDAWGEKRMFGIEYGNGLADENGHEIIFFEATPGDVAVAFYNLNGLYNQDGTKCVNDLFHLLNLPKTQLGELLVWDPNVLWDEWESDWIGYYTEDLELEDDVPVPATCTMIYFQIPPLAEGYADGVGIQDMLHPAESLKLQSV